MLISFRISRCFFPCISLHYYTMSKLGLYIDYFKDKLSEKYSSKKTNKNDK